MPLVLKGVMQSTVTPLKADFSPDLATFEREAFAEIAVQVVAKRVPVSIHVW